MVSFNSQYFLSLLIITAKSSWLIPLFVNASDILFYMVFNLLLASITISLYFFFLFLVVFNSFFMIPIEIENAKLKLALTIPTGASMTVANDAIELLSENN